MLEDTKLNQEKRTQILERMDEAIALVHEVAAEIECLGEKEVSLVTDQDVEFTARLLNAGMQVRDEGVVLVKMVRRGLTVEQLRKAAGEMRKFAEALKEEEIQLKRYIRWRQGLKLVPPETSA